jgi:hypothetical protein
MTTTYMLILWLSSQPPLQLPMDSMAACEDAAQASLKDVWSGDGIYNHAKCLSSDGAIVDFGNPAPPPPP